jgi:hypothetical protein
LIYLAIVLLVTWIMSRVERAVQIPGLEAEAGRV